MNEAEELDSGDPEDLAAGYTRLREVLPAASVFGGCCGTGVRHISAIAAVVSQSEVRARAPRAWTLLHGPASRAGPADPPSSEAEKGA
ncbi:MAG: homocysteine S-methyltransferase family protein [Actinomycetes bacterium]